jgi:hypothetical protein
MFLTMANVVTQLGVECEYCHVKTADGKFDYPVMTPKKEIANWMYQHLMQAVRPKNASRFSCKSCHADEKGKAVARIFGSPRDEGRAHEWMTLVMVDRFTTAKGQPLKCRACHVGNYSTDKWSPKVILHSEQIPAHGSPP